MQDLITIIVPVYKVEQYLHKCVDSILAQTYTNIEVILVDDGSPDNCGKICDKYAEKDKRVKVIHKANGGLAEARNVGLDIAHGEYLGFIDSDDWIELDMYEELYTALTGSNADLSMCGLNLIYKKNIVQIGIYDKPQIIENEELMRRYFTESAILSSACNKLYRKKLFDRLRYPVGRIFEDRHISLELFSLVDRAVHIGETKYNYLQRGGSIVHSSFNPRLLVALEIAEKEKCFINEKYPSLNPLAIESPAKAAVFVMKVIAALENFNKNREIYKKIVEYLAKEIESLNGQISTKQLSYYINICKHNFLFYIYCRLRHVIGHFAMRFFPFMRKGRGEMN